MAEPAAVVAERVGRVVSSGRFWIAETPGGELVIAWQPDLSGTQPGEMRLPRTLTTLVRRAAAGEDVSLAAVLSAMSGALRGRRG
jgi:hypothetical protein